MKQRRIVVTGVGGLIASHLAGLLAQKGDSVVGVDSFITGTRRNVPPGIELVEADCRDLSAMNHVCRDAEVVVHCAATPYEGLSVYSPHFVTDHVFGASSAVFSAAVACGVRRIVYTSSMARYGAAEAPFTEDQPPAPVDPYGVAKVAAEMLLKTLCHLHNRQYVICVPHNVVGPRQRYDDAYRNVAAIMINRMLSGKDVVIYGDGKQRRCFTHVLDVVEQMAHLIDAPEAAGETFNLGSDTGFITINELAQRIATLLGLPFDPVHLPPRHGEVRDATCSHARIEQLVEPASERTLEQALASLVEDIRKLGPRPLVPDLPLEIDAPTVPETWLAQGVRSKIRRSA